MRPVPVKALSRQRVQVLRLAQERVLQREQVRALLRAQALRPVPVRA